MSHQRSLFEGRKSHVVEMSCETMARLIRILTAFSGAILLDEDQESYPEEMLHLARTAAGLSEVLFDTRHDTVNQIMSLSEFDDEEEGFEVTDWGRVPSPRSGLLN